MKFLEPTWFDGTGALNFKGNEFAQYVTGNAGANVIDGGGGPDILEGLGGADLFAFTTALGNGNVDRINDFLTGFDRIELDHSVFAGLALGRPADGAVYQGSAAHDADDRLIYDIRSTGELAFDPDGDGAAAGTVFAVVGTGLNINANDFLVV